MSVCQICGEGEEKEFCVIDEMVCINGIEVMTLNHQPIYEDIAMYGLTCDVCGVEHTSYKQSQINRSIYVTARRSHGLCDSAINRCRKE